MQIFAAKFRVFKEIFKEYPKKLFQIGIFLVEFEKLGKFFFYKFIVAEVFVRQKYGTQHTTLAHAEQFFIVNCF